MSERAAGAGFGHGAGVVGWVNESDHAALLPTSALSSPATPNGTDVSPFPHRRTVCYQLASNHPRKTEAKTKTSAPKDKKADPTKSTESATKAAPSAKPKRLAGNAPLG
jgi:hypothetical protein